ncbi:uncharacterized protein LJ206_006511 isoform 3-T4 [Theristicus caerulescens]
MGTAAFHTTAPTATEMKWHLYTFHHPDCKTESIPMLLVLFGNLPQPSPRWMVTIDHTGPTAGKFICSWLDRVSVSVTSSIQTTGKGGNFTGTLLEKPCGDKRACGVFKPQTANDRAPQDQSSCLVKHSSAAACTVFSGEREF